MAAKTETQNGAQAPEATPVASEQIVLTPAQFEQLMTAAQQGGGFDWRQILSPETAGKIGRGAGEITGAAVAGGCALVGEFVAGFMNPFPNQRQ